jgi:uncharacterized membrane protein YkgB
MKNFMTSKTDLVIKILAGNQTLSARSALTKQTRWVDKFNIAFFIGYFGIIIMLLWGGAFKLTAPGAEGIVPFVTNSPLISWHFKVFGPYVGSDIIGSFEISAALLILTGGFYPKAGMIGTLISIGMFTITSSMFITTPGSTSSVNGMAYMSATGLFLYKDITSLAVSFYLLSHFRQKAIISENKTKTHYTNN